MPSKLPAQLKTYLAWRFDTVLSGSFRRNKADFAHHEYPIVAPLPKAGRNTTALERSIQGGPYVYFVCDDKDQVRYVGKSMESEVIHRWVRPGVGGSAKHYWTHSTASGGCVFAIAHGLNSSASNHYTLRYVPVSEMRPEMYQLLGIVAVSDPKVMAKVVERAMIRAFSPDWNKH